MKNSMAVLNSIKGGLIVSCQALEDEPLHSSNIMMHMAKAALMGGAVGIRVNSPKDCSEIKQNVDLPMIAIYKKVYGNCNVFITPTIEEVKKLLITNPEIIAEGNVDSPGNAVKCLDAGAYAVVVGAAITRPQLITKKFVNTIKNRVDIIKKTNNKGV